VRITGPLCIGIFLLITQAASYAVQPDRRAERTFEFNYRFTIKNVPADASKVRVWLPYPVSDAYQEIKRVSVTAPTESTIYTEPTYGNSVLYLESKGAKQGALEVGTKFIVKRRENAQPEFRRARLATTAVHDKRIERWLKPDRLVPLDERIRGLAQEVTEGAKTDVEKVRAIYEFVLDSMSYDKSGTGWGNGDIYWACDAKRGNCTDFHALFIGLARAVGIPAKFAIGFPIPDDRTSGEVSGYHCWSEFYLQGHGWIPVDASEAKKNPGKREYFFGNVDASRVQLTVGRDITLMPRQEGQPLNYFVYPYVEVDGKPFTDIEKQFTFADVTVNTGLTARAH
jgi:transglutaminase-like putative cysteine protease